MMNQIEYQRKAIMDDMDKSEKEKQIDLFLENARRSKGKPTGKWINKEAVRRD